MCVIGCFHALLYTWEALFLLSNIKGRCTAVWPTTLDLDYMYHPQKAFTQFVHSFGKYNLLNFAYFSVMI